MNILFLYNKRAAIPGWMATSGRHWFITAQPSREIGGFAAQEQCRPEVAIHLGTIRAALVLMALAFLLPLAGCDNLAKGTKIKPLEESKFFADGQSSRQPPAHSVAQGNLRIDTLLYTGRNPDGKLADLMPFPVNEAMLARGRQQYIAICANCHGPDGYGRGIIVRRGFPQPPSYHDEKLLKAPAGHLYDVITNGYGAMYPYANIVEVNDRWAIVAYIRALQRSQRATRADVPPDELAKLESATD